MCKLKIVINNLLYPKPIFFILSLLIGFGSVIITFLLHFSHNLFGYISYLLSAYSLIIVVVKIPSIYNKSYEKINNMKYAHKFIHDVAFRNEIILYVGFIFNLLYITYRFVIGIVFHSIWVGATAAYYLLLVSIRYYLLRNIKKEMIYEKKFRIYRLVGIFIFLLTIAMAGMTTSMIIGNKTISYPGHIIYIVALYTFYNFVVAIINFIKYRKMNNPILLSVKMISLVTACMSMFVLQVALISAFGSDENYELLMNSITGMVVLLIVICISIYMVVSSTRIIKIESR